MAEQQQQSLMESLLLTLGVDEKSRESWLKLGNAIENVGTAAANATKESGKGFQVMGVYSDSAVTSFGNVSDVIQKLSVRIESLSENFGMLNVAQQTGGAVIDVLNFKWAEMGNMLTRWGRLARTDLFPTLAATYVGYRLLSTGITMVTDAWYKSGQAMADQVKTQENMAETTARLTGSTDQLLHRYEKLADIRVYRSAGKELSDFGALTQSVSRTTALATSTLELLATQFATTVINIGVGSKAVQTFKKYIDEAATSMSKYIAAATGSDRSFNVKLFSDAQSALKDAATNMRLWSEETGIAETELRGSMERTARRTGDIALAHTMMTVALDKSFQTQHTNSRELMSIMNNLSKSGEISTESMRLFGANLKTNSGAFADAHSRLRLLVEEMLKLQSVDVRDSVYKRMTANATIAYGLMEQTIANYSEAEMTFNKKARDDFAATMKLKTTSWEEEVRRLRVLRGYVAEVATQEERRIGVLQGQIALQKTLKSTSFTMDYMPQLMELSKAMESYQTLLRNKGAAAAAGAFRDVATQATQLYNEMRDAGIASIEEMRAALIPATTAKVSVIEDADVRRAEAYGSALVGAYQKTADLNRTIFSMAAERFQQSNSQDSTRAERAREVVATYQRIRSDYMTTIDEYTDRVNSLEMTILDIYAMEGNAIQRNHQTRIATLTQAANRIQEIRRLTAASAAENLASLQKEFQMRQSAYNQQLDNIRRTETGYLMRDPTQRAEESAYDDRLAGFIDEFKKTGEVSPEMIAVVEKMSNIAQNTWNTFIQGETARRFKESGAADRIEAILARNSGDAGKAVTEVLKTFRNPEERQAALSYINSRDKLSPSQVRAMGTRDSENLDDLGKVRAEMERANASMLATISTNTQMLTDHVARSAEVVRAATKVVEETGPIVNNIQGVLELLMKWITDNLGANVGALQDIFPKYVRSMEEMLERIKIRSERTDEGKTLTTDEGFYRDIETDAALRGEVSKAMSDLITSTKAEARKVAESGMDEDQKQVALAGIYKKLLDAFSSNEALYKFAEGATGQSIEGTRERAAVLQVAGAFAEQLQATFAKQAPQRAAAESRFTAPVPTGGNMAGPDAAAADIPSAEEILAYERAQREARILEERRAMEKQLHEGNLIEAFKKPSTTDKETLSEFNKDLQGTPYADSEFYGNQLVDRLLKGSIGRLDTMVKNDTAPLVREATPKEVKETALVAETLTDIKNILEQLLRMPGGKAGDVNVNLAATGGVDPQKVFKLLSAALTRARNGYTGNVPPANQTTPTRVPTRP